MVDELAQAGPTAEEIARLHSRMVNTAGDVRIAGAEAWRIAEDALYGREFVAADEVRERVGTLSPADVQASTGAELGRGLFLIPPGAASVFGEDRRFAGHAHTPVRGTRCRPVPLPGFKADSRLTLSADGVTLFDGKKDYTVTTDTLAAVLRWDRGRRELVDEDGTSVRFEPARWRGGRRAVEELDAAIDRSLVVPMGPEPARPSAWRQAARYKGNTAALVAGAVVLWLLAIIMWIAELNPEPGKTTNLAGPLLFTFLSLVVTYALADRWGLPARWRKRRSR